MGFKQKRKMSEKCTIKRQFAGGGKRQNFRIQNWERRLTGLKTVLLRGCGRGPVFSPGKKGRGALLCWVTLSPSLSAYVQEIRPWGA
jgi:hypothetical protein